MGCLEERVTYTYPRRSLLHTSIVINTLHSCVVCEDTVIPHTGKVYAGYVIYKGQIMARCSVYTFAYGIACRLCVTFPSSTPRTRKQCVYVMY